MDRMGPIHVSPPCKYLRIELERVKVPQEENREEEEDKGEDRDEWDCN
jgi:hypothetical protein